MSESATSQEPPTIDGKNEPRPDEQYCPSCGDVVKEEAAFCPGCGVEIGGRGNDDKATLGFVGYAAFGVISGLISFLLVPVVFGPLSIFCGIQLYRKHSEPVGLGVAALGGVGLIIGMVLGMMVWS